MALNYVRLCTSEGSTGIEPVNIYSTAQFLEQFGGVMEERHPKSLGLEPLHQALESVVFLRYKFWCQF